MRLLRPSLSIALLSGALAAPALAQSGAYVVRLGNDTLAVEKFTKGGLLIRTSLQKQQHALQRLLVGDKSLIEFWPCERMDVSAQHHEILFVNCLGDARRDVRRLRNRSAKKESQEGSK